MRRTVLLASTPFDGHRDHDEVAVIRQFGLRPVDPKLVSLTNASSFPDSGSTASTVWYGNLNGFGSLSGTSMTKAFFQTAAGPWPLSRSVTISWSLPYATASETSVPGMLIR
jgi:hypothetical protein